MTIEKQARDTLTTVELDEGDELVFTLFDGTTRRIRLESQGAHIISTTAPAIKQGRHGAVTNYRFFCRIRIDGVAVALAREVASRRSFYEPREIMGLRIWFDACAGIFDFLNESHGQCRPRKQARFVIQDATRRICPTLLHPWCPLPAGGLRIEDCYEGEDVWLGAYQGADAHGGLDINHPAGTPIWAPIEIHQHEVFDSVERGDNNNRWRGWHHWPDGSTWVLQVHHIIRLLVPEDQPISAGTPYADGAGMLTGEHEHSHFVFRVLEPGAARGDEISIDPWILFWQMYRDRALTTAR